MQRLWRAKRWVKYRLAPHALILMYHRVAELENDPHLLAVTPAHFAAQLEVIHRNASPVSLQQVAAWLQLGNVPNRAVVITFDDGYADNFHEARPLLERYEIPATVFVTADQVGNRREFWWDELDRLLLQPGALPNRLELSLNGNTQTWDLGSAAEYSESAYRRDRAWHIEREDAPTVRHHLFLWLFDQLIIMPDNERRLVLEKLRLWAAAEPTARPTHQKLTSDEVVCLAAGGLVEIGAHTVTHPQLATLPADEQRREIQQSRECLETVLQRPVISFAFPHGSTTPETVSILQETGFSCACTSTADAVWCSTNPLQLPRVGVRDWDGDFFARWLKWWLDG
jgi:peptidoglycan/xylan/chitin deacetylase (PgdA/CDA1 family)